MPIKILDQLTHIKNRPGMYIGSTETPLHLIIELIDNSTDEILNSNGNQINVYIDTENFIYGIDDNGRGIPIRQNNIENDIPIVLATQLFSGGKFDKDMYVVKSGLHGIGLTVVNALSDWLHIYTNDKKYTYQYIFEDSKFIKKIRHKKQPFSTKIMFKPSAKFFERLLVDTEKVKEKLYVVKSIVPNTKIYLYNNGIKEEITRTILDEFMNGFYYISYSYKNKRSRIDIYMAIHDYNRRNVVSVINGLLVKNGTHINLFEQLLREYLFKLTNDKFIKVTDLLTGTRTLLLITIPEELSFSSQTKESMTIPKNKLNKILNKNVIAALVENNKDFFMQVIDIAHKYRLSYTAKKLKIKKTKTVSVEQLKDCLSNDIKERELFLLEGESAGGTLLSVRDINKHAILPLRGKIINSANNKHDKVLSSKVVQNIIKAVGLKPYTSDLSSIRYNKVIILTDADEDGKHIATLLITLFYTISPEFIKQRHLYIIEPPLFGTYKKDKFIPIYDKNELKKYNKYNRFKGLGEMQSNEIYEVALSNKRRLIEITFDKSIDINKLWAEMKGQYKNLF